MRITALFLLPALALSFAPQPHISRVPTSLTDKVDDLCADVSNGAETILETADKYVLRRVMSAVNHAPAILTLKNFASAAGSSRLGVDVAASAFSYSAPSLLALPTWMGNIWRVACVIQIASLAKSILVADNDELSQGDITALTASNFAATKALTSGTLGWLVATSVMSSYAARNGGDSEPNIHNTSSQIVSSFTTAAAILGTTAAFPSIFPVLLPRLTIKKGLRFGPSLVSI